MKRRMCRYCAYPLTVSFCDLGMTPLSNSYIPIEQADRMEPFYPLHAYVCEQCFLVQLDEFEPAQSIFSDYAYFSSYSDSWLAHAERYAAHMIRRLGLSTSSLAMEIASNDGYLLQYFKSAGIPVHGVEPAANVAKVAMEKGIPTTVDFFGKALADRLAAQGLKADLLAGNNVFAHVPDLNDFVAGFVPVLKPDGVLTLEFPHLLHLIDKRQFDTIYHEHFSYFSFGTARKVLEHHGLRVFDVQELPTHGGSLRIFASLASSVKYPVDPAVSTLLNKEERAGLGSLDTYRAFGEAVKKTKRDILAFLIQAKNEGKRICAYGAPAKGNTLLNFCGIGPDFIDFTVDRNPAKQGTLLPGSRIPVLAPDALTRTKPDLVLILPWNLRDEIMQQLMNVREWGGRFVVPIPSPSVC